MSICNNMFCAVASPKVVALAVFSFVLHFLVLVWSFREILQIDFWERKVNPDKTISVGKMKFLFFTKANNNGYFHKKVIAMELIGYFLSIGTVVVLSFGFLFDAQWPDIVAGIWLCVVLLFSDIVSECRKKLMRQVRRLMLNDKL